MDRSLTCLASATFISCLSQRLAAARRSLLPGLVRLLEDGGVQAMVPFVLGQLMGNRWVGESSAWCEGLVGGWLM